MVMVRGTRLGALMGHITMDHEDPRIACWRIPRSKTGAGDAAFPREILYFNLFHPAATRHVLKHIGNVGTLQHRDPCINPWHMKRGAWKSEGWPHLYDHPHIVNRWALLLWYLDGNKDHNLVDLDAAVQLFQEQTPGYSTFQTA